MVAALPDPGAATLLAPCLQTEQQLLVLVESSFASGSFGHCSIWLGVEDNKLYLRKLMTTSARKSKPPKDISAHRKLPMVPTMVTYFRHEPVPRRVGIRWDGEVITQKARSKNFWSAIYEFIPGSNLAAIFLEARRTNRSFPEPMIWEFGKVMLEFLQELLFSDEMIGTGKDATVRRPWNHNDLYPRNIIVSDDNTRQRSCNFHVIDFGRATTTVQQRTSTNDLANICDMLDTMMQCSVAQLQGPLFQDRTRTVGSKIYPYSCELISAVDDLWFMLGTIDPESFDLSKERFVGHVRIFQNQAREKLEDFRAKGRDYSLQIFNPIPYPEPLWWPSHDQPVEKMKEFMSDKYGCLPCQSIWASNSTPPETWRVEKCWWGAPEYDPQYNSDCA